MRQLWRWLVNWWRGPVQGPSLDTQRAAKRLADVSRDDARVDRLGARMTEVRRTDNLGPAISRALRARRP